MGVCVCVTVALVHWRVLGFGVGKRVLSSAGLIEYTYPSRGPDRKGTRLVVLFPA